MAATTIKLSTETRDRLKAKGGPTYEDTIVEMLDRADEEEFWVQADRAAAWLRSQSPDRRSEIRRQETAVAAAFDGLE